MKLSSALAVDKKRIWELDLLKGLAFLFMAWDHTVFDLSDFFGVDVSALGVFKEGIGYVSAGIFMTVCGISVTLGKRNLKHGSIVFGLGMALTLGTWIAQLVSGMQIIICFGILHFLGLSMVIGHFAKKLPNTVIALFAIASAALGIWFETLTVSAPFLFPFGLCTADFYSSDFFPLFPNLAFTFAGIIIGKLLYKEKRRRIPFAPKKSILCLMGRHTLLLYFVHQPVIIAVLYLIFLIIR